MKYKLKNGQKGHFGDSGPLRGGKERGVGEAEGYVILITVRFGDVELVEGESVL